ncbi:MAG: monovalent cation/H(+) antiporter subunit G [Gemmatimonadota bacterium]|nr:monovalent cation/H(+) antiporter subunit G [Gemmatimonadota bacterium]
MGLSAVDWLEALRELTSIALVGGGVAFFLAGSVGLLRFPDLFTRLHAVTKADNVGLGLVVGGLAVEADSVRSALALIGIWLLVIAGSSVVSHLIARRARTASDARMPSG